MMRPITILTACRNIGVLQTTVAEVVTVEKHEGELPKNMVSSDSPTAMTLTTCSPSVYHHAFCMVSWVSHSANVHLFDV
jgi:hypothetical protein